MANKVLSNRNSCRFKMECTQHFYFLDISSFSLSVNNISGPAILSVGPANMLRTLSEFIGGCLFMAELITRPSIRFHIRRVIKWSEASQLKRRKCSYVNRNTWRSERIGNNWINMPWFQAPRCLVNWHGARHTWTGLQTMEKNTMSLD